ncbi:unnamed protein product, partial [Porites lobata]
ANVEFTSSALSGCQDGRVIGSVPTVTDDRLLRSKYFRLRVPW